MSARQRRVRRAADDPTREERALRHALDRCIDALLPSPNRRRRSGNRGGGNVDAGAADDVTAASWLDEPGVQGIGIARRSRRSRRGGELALVVYVDEKRDANALAAPVPESLSVAGIDRAVPTDVVAIGTLRLQGAPLMPGAPVDTGHAGPGTFGCVVARTDDPHGRYLLSCAHVLAPLGAQAGDEVDAPASLQMHGGATIARLADWTVTADGTQPFTVDAAIALLDDPDAASEFIRDIGAPTDFGGPIARGLRVRKSGARTGLTHSVVQDLDFVAIVDFPVRGGGTRRIAFRDLVRCDQFTLDGDSGAVVLDASRRVVGVHMMGSAKASVFCRADAVGAALRVTLPD